jgi:hypothetical protein
MIKGTAMLPRRRTPTWAWCAALVVSIVTAPAGVLLSGYMLNRRKPREWLGWGTLLALSLAVTLVAWVFR